MYWATTIKSKKLIQWQHNKAELVERINLKQEKLFNDFTIKQNLYQTTTNEIEKKIITDFTIKQ